MILTTTHFACLGRQHPELQQQQWQQQRRERQRQQQRRRRRRRRRHRCPRHRRPRRRRRRRRRRRHRCTRHRRPCRRGARPATLAIVASTTDAGWARVVPIVVHCCALGEVTADGTH